MTDAEPAAPAGTPQWARTYRDNAPRLMALATVLVGRDDACDLVADSVIRAVHSPSWPTVQDHRAFLVRSLVNEASSRHRSNVRRLRREERVAQRDGDHRLDPADLLDVRTALSRLSQQQRVIVYLAYWEDLSIGDIARWLAVGEGTVRRQLDRAKSKLREVLK